MKSLHYFFTGFLFFFLVACSPEPSKTSQAENTSAVLPATETHPQETAIINPGDVSQTLNSQEPNATNSQTTAYPTPMDERPQATATTITTAIVKTPKPTPGMDDWQKLPVIPEISDKVIEIYQAGLALGNDPHKFSKIGDCGSTPAWFLGDFDRGPDFYDLGEHEYLNQVIAEFHGSFERTSLAARSGFNASSLFSPLWSDRSSCQANESPLACEYRVHKPAIAFIMLGTNDIWKPEEFEPQMRKIIEFSIENGIIPIISTKADNAEGDHIINMTIARLAWEYEIPLLNYWLAVQPLPDQGLQEDGAHLTWGRNFFNDSQAMSKAWPVRNLTALQALNAVWQKIYTQD